MTENGPFKNLHPHPTHSPLAILRWKLKLDPVEEPPAAVKSLPLFQPEVCAPDLERLHHPAPEQVQLTWVGHTTFLLQHAGRNILTDPIFGKCWPGLRRMSPPGLTLAQLPPIHAVLISHNHYDHLDATAVKHLGNTPAWWVPLGVKPWFAKRGITRVTELGWWDSAAPGEGLELHCVPAQHFAARTPFDRNRTLWCGWVLRSRTRSVYFAGDTGYCPVFREIGERFGGFDLSMIPIGAYRPRRIMQPIHVDPYEAVQIHLDVRSRRSIASHWGTFQLTDEPLNEPPALLPHVLAERGVPANEFQALRFGETIAV